MQADFWHDKWKNNRIGWHLDEVNPILVKHINALDLDKGARIFIPLCGKTKDIAWLLKEGYNVVGAEVAVLVDGMTAPGTHTVSFDASNLSSGVYFYSLEAAGNHTTRKMLLTK